MRQIGIFFFALFLCSLVWACTRSANSRTGSRTSGMFQDVSVLKKEYPVIHYLKPDPKLKDAPTHSQDFYVTIEKNRPPHWVKLSDVSKKAIEAIIVSEDWAFYQHKGYDPNQIRAAVKERIDQGRMRGASTITQQVARNVFLSQDQNVFRKLAELFIAVKLEENLGKGKILEIYLNIAEWGEGIFGIDEAAHHYFEKNPSELTAKEGAFLAMLLPSPKRYAQSYKQKELTDYAADTVETILDKMVQAHWLTSQQKADEWAHPLSFEKIARVAPPHPEDAAAAAAQDTGQPALIPTDNSIAPPPFADEKDTDEPDQPPED